MKIGHKLKTYRIMNNLTQEELASRCELSKGFLSQIENDLTSPSISTLNDIVEALGIDLATFFQQDEESQLVFRQEDFFIDEQEDYTITWIVPNAQKNIMEPILIDIKAHSISQKIEPFDGEVFGYVLEGSMLLHYGEKSYLIKEHESFTFNGKKSHYLENINDVGARVIWVSTPPIF